MPNRYDGYYQGRRFSDPYPPPTKKGAPLLLVMVVSLLFGLVGGGLSWYLLEGTRTQPQSPNVVLQSSSDPVAAPEPNPLPQQQLVSIAERVAAEAGPSVVEVSTESKKTHPFFGSYVTGGAGSGVIISADGYIVTNHHVIADSTSAKIRLSNGQEYPAALVGSDSQTDLAVLKIDATDLPTATFADSDQVNVGQPVIAIGNPLGTLGGTVTEGIISAKNREINLGDSTMELLQTSAAINPGNSGGGLFDQHALLIGVVNAKSSGNDIEGLGFAIPANTAQKVVADIIQHGRVTGRPWLGAEFVEVGSVEALYRYRVNEYGVYVTGAVVSSELQRGDRLLTIDDQPISTVAQVKQIVAQHQVGDTVVVAVSRSGRVTELSVILLEQ